MLRKKGFTLMELLVVVMIVVILTAIVLPKYEKASLKASAMRMLPMMRAIRQAQQAYFLETRENSCNDADWDLKIKVIPGGKSGTDCTTASGFTYELDSTEDATVLKVYSDRVSYDMGNILTINYHLLGTTGEGEWKARYGNCHGTCRSGSRRGEQVCKGFGPLVGGGNGYCIQ